ncbi:MAG TPA: TolC family outer membrane protein [Hyphomicrobium sp.]|nr:TolC family outer membrane protein [Hyphomicrobium sp.]
MRTAIKKKIEQQWVSNLGKPSARRNAGLHRAALAGGLALGVVFALTGHSAPVSAETLKEALSAAYGYNPRLDAQRAFQRASDEDVARAMSGYRPTITGNADIGIERSDQRPSNLLDGVTKPRGYGVQAVQPIFSGFRTYNAVNEAEANVRAERSVLRDVERSVLLQAVTAYMDVVRDQELVRLNENNVNVLSRELKAAQDRFSVGEVTRTDVAQAEARRADAVSRLDAARANLRTSRGSYQQVIGHPPTGLTWPGPPNELLPRTLQDAIGVSNNEDPLVVAALFREQAAKFTVERIRGELLPTVQLEASYNDRFGSSKLTDEVEQSSLVGRAIIPIYEAGDVYARVRQAKQNHIGILQQIEQVRTEQTQTVVAAWSQLEAARAQLESDRVAVESNKVALQGVREEEKVGQRTLLDVLNAELEYLNSQVNLETTRRNLVVASYAVLSSMGRLDAEWIGAASYVYDPNVHYKEVRRKWIGLSITYGDGRTETFEAQPGTVEGGWEPVK